MRSHGFAAVLAFGAIWLSAPGSDAGELRDPTRPPSRRASRAGSAPPSARIELQAVWVSPQRRVARINGKEVEEGDLAFGGRVGRIEPAAVTLVRGGEALVLTFTQTVIRPVEGQP